MPTMNAFVHDPDAPGRTVLAEVPEPEPAPDEALVAVEAYSLNRGEIFLLDAPRDGWRPGQDVAGRVERDPRRAAWYPRSRASSVAADRARARARHGAAR